MDQEDHSPSFIATHSPHAAASLSPSVSSHYDRSECPFCWSSLREQPSGASTPSPLYKLSCCARLVHLRCVHRFVDMRCSVERRQCVECHTTVSDHEESCADQGHRTCNQLTFASLSHSNGACQMMLDGEIAIVNEEVMRSHHRQRFLAAAVRRNRQRSDSQTMQAATRAADAAMRNSSETETPPVIDLISSDDDSDKPRVLTRRRTLPDRDPASAAAAAAANESSHPLAYLLHPAPPRRHVDHTRCEYAGTTAPNSPTAEAELDALVWRWQQARSRSDEDEEKTDRKPPELN